MSEWKLITKDSPTEEEAKKGIIVGNWENGPLATHWDTYSCCDRSWSSKRTHWAPVIPPPRPDPDKEACERYIQENEYAPSSLHAASVREGWAAALAYARGGGK